MKPVRKLAMKLLLTLLLAALVEPKQTTSSQTTYVDVEVNTRHTRVTHGPQKPPEPLNVPDLPAKPVDVTKPGILAELRYTTFETTPVDLDMQLGTREATTQSINDREAVYKGLLTDQQFEALRNYDGVSTKHISKLHAKLTPKGELVVRALFISRQERPPKKDSLDFRKQQRLEFAGASMRATIKQQKHRDQIKKTVEVLEDKGWFSTQTSTKTHYPIIRSEYDYSGKEIDLVLQYMKASVYHELCDKWNAQYKRRLAREERQWKRYEDYLLEYKGEL